jgi:hypothetical protein
MSSNLILELENGIYETDEIDVDGKGLVQINFNVLEWINGDLIISNNNLSSINFKNIEGVNGSIYAGGNHILRVNVGKLREIGKDFDLSGNPLRYLDLSNIKTIGGNLQLPESIEELDIDTECVKGDIFTSAYKGNYTHRTEFGDKRRKVTGGKNKR